jgi:cytochrome P450
MLQARPQRFLGSAHAAIDRFAYLPFGAGPRKCIGSTFALQEATLVLAAIVKRFSFQLRPGHAVWPSLAAGERPADDRQQGGHRTKDRQPIGAIGLLAR